MVTVKLKGGDNAKFAKTISDLAKLSGKPVEQILKEQGRLFAVDAARFTNRVGNTAQAGRDHKADVKSTIDMIYINPLFIAKTISKRHGKKKGNKFANYIRRREAGKAQAMIDQMGITRGKGGHRIEVGMFDGGNRHTRWLKGRRTTVQCVMGYTGVVPKYKKAKVASVGSLKQGWALAAKDLGGTRGIPAYAKKGHKTRGHGSVKGKFSKAVLTVTNRSEYILKNTTAKSLWKLRMDNMSSVMGRILQRKAKAAAKRLTK